MDHPRFDQEGVLAKRQVMIVQIDPGNAILSPRTSELREDKCVDLLIGFSTFLLHAAQSSQFRSNGISIA